MLSLKTSTTPAWVDDVESHLEEILIDHALCEQKAASVAMSLIGAYVEKTELVRRLAPIVTEELEHFEMVLKIIEERGFEFRRIPPGTYGKDLTALARKKEPQRAVDRLLIGALIEARSCQRFALLRDRIADKKLSRFYGELFDSEARHYATYVQMAELFAESDDVKKRLDELAAEEAEIIERADGLTRMHSR